MSHLEPFSLEAYAHPLAMPLSVDFFLLLICPLYIEGHSNLFGLAYILLTHNPLLFCRCLAYT